MISSFAGGFKTRLATRQKAAKESASQDIKPRGALAQLVERFHGMEEVSGSTPLCSTIHPYHQVLRGSCYGLVRSDDSVGGCTS